MVGAAPFVGLCILLVVVSMPQPSFPMLGVHRHERAVLAPLALLPSVSARSIAKVEVFDDERTVTTGHGRTAGAAYYLAIDGLRSCFTLDDLIKGIAVRTGEEKRARWRVRRHDYAPKTL